MRLLLLLFLASAGPIQGADILVILPFPAYSHTMMFMPIVEGLADRGHNITLVTAMKPKKSHENINLIPVDFDMSSDFIKAGNLASMSSYQRFVFPLMLFHLPLAIMPKMLETEGLQRILHDTSSKFDLVMLEPFFMQELFITFGHKFNAPVVNLDTIGLLQTTYYTGNLYPFSYIPNKFLPFTDRMSFIERTLNTIMGVMMVAASNLYYLPSVETLKNKYFTYSDDIPSVSDMLRNVSLSLVTSSSIVHYPRPLHKNMIEVITQIPKTPEPLPKDLKDYMDSAKDGVIYFTLGSHLKSEDLKPETVEILTTAFGKLKQKVLWKWTAPNLPPNLPPNVKLGKWFPQTTILNHTNTKAFITHGGYNSYFESMYFGVPIIGIPLMADQTYNLRSAVSKGTGIPLSYQTLSVDSLYTAIQTILNNPSYKENAARLSGLLRDSPATVDNALFWVEHVLKYNGAKHLRPASTDLYLYQYLLLDVAAFLALILGCIVALPVLLCRMCCSKTKKQLTDTKKKTN